MSTKKNFFYSSFLTLANYIFPLLTFPYVSRVLGVDAIGKYSFIDNIVQILIVVSMLGIGVVGVREIAQNKNSQERLNKSFTALLVFNAISTSFAIIVLFILLFSVSKFADYRNLLIIGGLKLFSTFLLVDWLYKGLEDFKFITQRTLVIRIIFVLSVFLFVRDKEDYVLYYFLIVFSITINAIVNLIYARKYIKLDYDSQEIKRIAKPILILGAYSVLAWLYNSFSTSFLGFVSNDEQVGFYSTATKLYTIFLSVITAFTTVMLPKLSQLVSQNNLKEFQQQINKSFNAIMTISIPSAVFAMFFASDIIRIISGSGFEGAAVPMIIVMPIIVVVGIEQLLIMQILMPLKHDREVMINTMYGAVAGIVLNVLLVPSLLCVGAAICWLTSELVVMSSAIYFIRKKTELVLPFSELKGRVIPLLVVIVLSSVMHNAFLHSHILVRLGISAIVVSIIVFFVERFIVKNPIIQEIQKSAICFIKDKWKR